MTQKPYFRDVWALPNSNSGYPGAFPRGLINKIKKKWWGKERLWLFSGSFKDSEGTTVDINPEVKPDYVCDCAKLPFLNNSFDFVMADPPYSIEEARKLYDLSYFNLTDSLNEMARVCKPEGHVIFLHRLVPACHPQFNDYFKRLKMVAVVGVYTIAGFSNMRALTVWKKQQTISSWVDGQPPRTGVTGKSLTNPNKDDKREME